MRCLRSFRVFRIWFFDIALIPFVCALPLCLGWLLGFLNWSLVLHPLSWLLLLYSPNDIVSATFVRSALCVTYFG